MEGERNYEVVGGESSERVNAILVSGGVDENRKKP